MRSPEELDEVDWAGREDGWAIPPLIRMLYADHADFDGAEFHELESHVYNLGVVGREATVLAVPFLAHAAVHAEFFPGRALHLLARFVDIDISARGSSSRCAKRSSPRRRGSCPAWNSPTRSSGSSALQVLGGCAHSLGADKPRITAAVLGVFENDFDRDVTADALTALLLLEDEAGFLSPVERALASADSVVRLTGLLCALEAGYAREVRERAEFVDEAAKLAARCPPATPSAFRSSVPGETARTGRSRPCSPSTATGPDRVRSARFAVRCAGGVRPGGGGLSPFLSCESSNIPSARKAANAVARERTTIRSRWAETDIPDLSGRTALITGANTGLGFRAAHVLAERGAHVILACRNQARPIAPPRDRRGRGPAPPVRPRPRSAWTLRRRPPCETPRREIRDRFPRLDLLINNAGVMDIPLRRTEDGFEATLATNHLGPFALTGLLLDRLAAHARIVTLSSVAHLQGAVDFDDLQSHCGLPPRRGLRAVQAGESAVHLRTGPPPAGRRLRGEGARLPSRHRENRSVRERLRRGTVTAQPPHAVRQLLGRCRTCGWAHCRRCVRRPTRPRRAASTTVHAATVCAAASTPAIPRSCESNARSHDAAVQARLWKMSEQLTGVVYPGLG